MGSCRSDVSDNSQTPFYNPRALGGIARSANSVDRFLAMNVQESSPLALRSTVSLLLYPNMVLITCLPRCTTTLARERPVFSQLERAKSLFCIVRDFGDVWVIVAWVRCSRQQ
jgi:hypothetical protein